MNRTENLSRIRLTLNLSTEQSTPIEKFQNEVLRPILKFQNDLLIHIFQQYAIKRKSKFALKSKIEQQQFIQQSLTKDQRLKQLFLGVVIGHFTTDEYNTYISNESEYNRRMTTMLIQRLDNQLI